MFNFIIQAVRKGNEHRREKYGEPETCAESFKRAREYRKRYNETLVPRAASFFMTKQQCRDIDALKLQYQYWDSWTGGRFAREENPYINREYFNRHHGRHPVLAVTRYDNFIKQVKLGEVLRSDPVTGHWYPYGEQTGQIGIEKQ